MLLLREERKLLGLISVLGKVFSAPGKCRVESSLPRAHQTTGLDVGFCPPEEGCPFLIPCALVEAQESGSQGIIGV